MTLVSDIITRAYRESNIIPMGSSPIANQVTEALPLLNSIYLSSVGVEIGDDLHDLNIGGQYSETDVTTNYVPANARMLLNLTGTMTFYLDPEPFAGQRLSFVDIGNNLATYNVTLNGNGRNIEGASSLVLNVSGDTRQWIYLGTTGNWTKITSLVSGDTFPFPTDFDDYFITMLAMRLNPRYGMALSQETADALKRARKNLRNRYRNLRDTMPEYMGVLGEWRHYPFGVNQFGRGSYWWR